MVIVPELGNAVHDVEMNDDGSMLNDDAVILAARGAGHQPALTGCPWHDVNEMLQAAGLRPTRQRMAPGWLVFGKGRAISPRKYCTRKPPSPRSRSRSPPSITRSISSPMQACCARSASTAPRP